VSFLLAYILAKVCIVYDTHLASLLTKTLVPVIQQLHEDATLSASLKFPLVLLPSSSPILASLDFSDLAAVEHCVENFRTKYVILSLNLDVF
jgi:hypothetical protein